MQIIFEFLKTHADVANAIAALAGVIIAFCALFVAYFANRTANKSLALQQKHNVLSLKPIPEVTVADYEDSLRVKLRNNGMGTLIITAARFESGTENRETLIDLMPALPKSRPWTHFTADLVGRTLQPSKFLPLVELTRFEGEENFENIRDEVRCKLRDIEIIVEYTDVYGTKYDSYTKELSWFGRNLPN